LRKDYDIETRWTAFPLHPDIPEEGLVVADVYRERGIDLEQARARLQQAADDAGLPLGKRERSYNSRLAQELGKWAEALGRGDDFHHAAFRAYFVDGKNIGKQDILVRLAGALGLPVDEAQEALEKRTYKKAVDADWARSYEVGITAVPTLMLGRKVIVGAQPYDVMEWFMKTNAVKKRKHQKLIDNGDDK
jgi:predicted DsbA family dithiol-disulfide isomerase